MDKHHIFIDIDVTQCIVRALSKMEISPSCSCVVIVVYYPVIALQRVIAFAASL